MTKTTLLSLFSEWRSPSRYRHSSAQAQATRTWVSGVGDDADPCSRTAPCKTFAGAISKTATSGEINCLDSAGFGAVTITKSITIRCKGVIGGILAAGTTGVIINSAGAEVILDGLDINGGRHRHHRRPGFRRQQSLDHEHEDPGLPTTTACNVEATNSHVVHR